jgi:hypothetical protein
MNTRVDLARPQDLTFTVGISCEPKQAISRISRASLVHAIAKVRAMDVKQKADLIAEVACSQPNIHACVLIQRYFGVSPEKLNHLLHIMLICFQAMKESELVWPIISVSEIDCHMAVYIGLVKCDARLATDAHNKALTRYIDDHLERELFAYVNEEVTHWLTTIEPEYTDKYIMIVAATIVSCIAYAPIAEERRHTSGKKTPIRCVGFMQ